MSKTEFCVRSALVFLGGVLSTAVVAEPMTYNIDSAHTFPAFSADHASGFSIWRGKIEETSGTIVLDATAETGTVDVTMQMATIDFGHDGMNEHVRSADFFDVERFPTATYTGTLTGFTNGEPTTVEGSLTMHGMTRPLNLEIAQFTCIESHRATNKPACGAEVTGSLDRADWGVDYDSNGVHQTWVNLMIQVEARAAE